ncbi:MAG: methionine/alanine import family NSS transporter small subunit [Anaerotignum sp.]|jgi:hypothetical protein|nr:methionine/alanine import family NSS transporter small subunit [Anaerotignum sp.]
MSTAAIVMMAIACVGLWGGFAVAVGIAIKSNKEK